MSIAYFSLPGLFEHFDFYKNFLNIYNKNRDKFYSYAKIESIYGAPGECIWNGGRVHFGFTGFENEILDYMQHCGINCRLTFTNPLIKDELLNDYYANFLLKLFYNSSNGIIVNSAELENYIRDNYPNYKFISSTTKGLTQLEELGEEMEKDYNLVVLDYNLNNSDAINQLPHKEKCEVLVNPVCKPHCLHRQNHYHMLAEMALKMPFNQDYSCIFDCPYQYSYFFDVQHSPLFVSNETINNLYLSNGINHFKIEGRSLSDADLTEILLYYLVKPEYQLEIRQRLYMEENQRTNFT